MLDRKLESNQIDYVCLLFQLFIRFITLEREKPLSTSRDLTYYEDGLLPPRRYQGPAIRLL